VSVLSALFAHRSLSTFKQVLIEYYKNNGLLLVVVFPLVANVKKIWNAECREEIQQESMTFVTDCIGHHLPGLFFLGGGRDQRQGHKSEDYVSKRHKK
jgi:hypothetical protein